VIFLNSNLKAEFLSI